MEVEKRVTSAEEKAKEGDKRAFDVEERAATVDAEKKKLITD